MSLFVLAGLFIAITIGLGRLQPASPTVDRRSIWTGSVEHGTMIHQVRGVGTLVAEQTLWAPAMVAGRVGQIDVLPGMPVETGTILMRLTNHELKPAVLIADSELRAAQNELVALQAKLQNDLLTMQAKLVEHQSNYDIAKIEYEVKRILPTDALPKLELRSAEVKVKSLKRVVDFEEKRVNAFRESFASQESVLEAQISKAQTMLELEHARVESLNVVAGMDGVLEQVAVEVGQRVSPDDALAKVVNPRHLKAELKIPEVQARFVALGQTVEVDTHHGIISGTVSRIQPAVKDGSVTVDVQFDDALPANARPDLSVIGTIEIERIDNVDQVDRPLFAVENMTIDLFRVDESGEFAVRVPVRIGRA
jgi:HlyD family secretion protein